MILIKGGDVLTPAGWTTADVRIDGAAVSEVGDSLDPQGSTVVDARGMWVGPGFVDLHTHLREPGQTWKEDVETGCEAAAAGGFTALVAMPNTDPAIATPEQVASLVGRGTAVGLAEVSASAAVTRGRAGAELADLRALWECGVRLFSDDGDSVGDEGLLAEAMATLAGLPGAILSQHAEDQEMTRDGHMHEGEISRRLGIGGLPSEAESSVVERDLRHVADSGASYHCQHVSARRTVELLRAAKAEGLAVTAEVTPHHLLLVDADVGDRLDPNLKMYPPLRSLDDRAALREGLIDRTIDVVATDHAPHTISEKEVSFSEAPRGVIGLETAASAVFESVGDRSLVFEALSVVPARIGGFPRQGRPVEVGGPANIVVFDPNQTWVPESFRSKSSNSPFLGREMKGRVITTIYEGRVTHTLERAS